MTVNPFTKLDRPPAAENWVRMNHPDVERTTKKLFGFAKSGPPIWNYVAGRKAAKYRVEDRINRNDAIRIATSSGNKLGRPFNAELIKSFLDYEQENPLDGVKAFDDQVEFFPLRRNLAIPIKPLTVIRKDGRFTPIFLCPWSVVSIDDYQARLLMTILERSIYTYSEFEDSVGQILFFPKRDFGLGLKLREPMIWTRGQFELLSDTELADQIKIFFESREIAKVLYQEHLNNN